MKQCDCQGHAKDHNEGVAKDPAYHWHQKNLLDPKDDPVNQILDVIPLSLGSNDLKRQIPWHQDTCYAQNQRRNINQERYQYHKDTQNKRQG